MWRKKKSISLYSDQLNAHHKIIKVRVESYRRWAKDTLETTPDNQNLSLDPKKDLLRAALAHLLSADCSKYQCLLTAIVTRGKTCSSLLIFASTGLNDQACENVQEQAEQSYTDCTFFWSWRSWWGSLSRWNCTVLYPQLRYSQRAGDTPASQGLPAAQQQRGVVLVPRWLQKRAKGKQLTHFEARKEGVCWCV